MLMCINVLFDTTAKLRIHAYAVHDPVPPAHYTEPQRCSVLLINIPLKSCPSKRATVAAVPEPSVGAGGPASVYGKEFRKRGCLVGPVWQFKYQRPL